MLQHTHLDSVDQTAMLTALLENLATLMHDGTDNARHYKGVGYLLTAIGQWRCTIIADAPATMFTNILLCAQQAI